jgi:hypothetical protein
MKRTIVTLAVLFFAVGTLSLASAVSASDDIPGGPGKPPVFEKFFVKLYAGETVELVRNGPLYVEAVCPDAPNTDKPRIFGKSDVEGALARCTQESFTKRWYPDGSGNPAAFLDPGDNCVIHNETNEMEPFFNTDVTGGLLVAPTGEVLEIPANSTGVGVHVLGADCLFVGVATLYTGNP